MSLESALSIARQYAQSSLAQLPESAQNALLNPLVQKALTAALVYGALRQTNRLLSQWSINNWQRAHPWQGDRELVLVSGGCSGIGKQIMEDLSRKGIRVVILDINEPNFQLPRNVHFFKADITNSESIRAVAEKIRQKLGDPTVLVNNAGVGYDGTILDEPEAKIRQTFEVNTISHFLMVREFLPSMIRQNHGHVITIASMASFVALGEMVDYCCTKASALAFHEGLTQELRYWYQARKVRTRYEATFDLTGFGTDQMKCYSPTLGSYSDDPTVDRRGKPIQAARDDTPGGIGCSGQADPHAE